MRSHGQCSSDGDIHRALTGSAWSSGPGCSQHMSIGAGQDMLQTASIRNATGSLARTPVSPIAASAPVSAARLIL